MKKNYFGENFKSKKIGIKIFLKNLKFYVDFNP